MMLPWLTRQVAVSERCAEELWQAACRDAEAMTGERDTACYWGAAKHRLLDLLAIDQCETCKANQRGKASAAVRSLGGPSWRLEHRLARGVALTSLCLLPLTAAIAGWRVAAAAGWWRGGAHRFGETAGQR